jgi:beta-lactamase class A
MRISQARLAQDDALDRMLADAVRQAERACAGVVRRASACLGDLQTMRYGEADADADIYPASIIKIPIMAETFHQVATGALRLHDTVTVSAANQTPTSGPAPFVPGYVATIAELVELMIVHSDNVATNQLMDVLRRENVTAFMHELGLQTFLLGRKLSGAEPLIDDPEKLGRNRLPAAEIGRLLTLIAEDAIAASAQQRDILGRCADDCKLVPGLPSGDVFMHKTGETSSVSHDAGILLTASGKRYVVVLYCEVAPKADRSDADHANPFMADWMRVIRECL